MQYRKVARETGDRMKLHESPRPLVEDRCRRSTANDVGPADARLHGLCWLALHSLGFTPQALRCHLLRRFKINLIQNTCESQAQRFVGNNGPAPVAEVAAFGSSGVKSSPGLMN